MSTWRLQQVQVTDCKSLFDAVSAEHPKTTEKRTYIDIRSIQQFIMRWCPEVMWADGLTKATSLRDGLRKWLDAPFTQLTEPSRKGKHN